MRRARGSARAAAGSGRGAGRMSQFVVAHLPADEDRDPCLQAQKTMRNPAERDQCALFFLLEFLSFAMNVLGKVALRAQPEARDHHESGQCEHAKDRQQHDPADGADDGRRAAAAAASAWRRRSRRPCRPVAASRRCAAGKRRKRRRAPDPRARIPARISIRPNGRCVSRRQPQIAIGSTSTIEARPKSWIDRSATIAPVRPSRLRTDASVAWLRLGSCTDQVASASGQNQREHE